MPVDSAPDLKGEPGEFAPGLCAQERGGSKLILSCSAQAHGTESRCTLTGKTGGCYKMALNKWVMRSGFETLSTKQRYFHSYGKIIVWLNPISDYPRHWPHGVGQQATLSRSKP